MDQTACPPVCSPIVRCAGALVGVLGLWLSLSTSLPGQDFAATWFVSPVPGVGQDGPGRGTRRETPLRSVARALTLAGEYATQNPAAPLRIALLAGTYTDVVDGTTQAFPLVLPTHVALLQIDAADGPGQVVLRPPHSGLSVFEYAEAGSSPGEVTYRLQDLRVEGGIHGLHVLAISRERFTLELQGCEFSDQRVRNVSITAVAGAVVDVNIASSTFTRSLGGLLLSAPPLGRLSLAISASRFTHIRPYSPSGLLGGGVELNLEPASWFEGDIHSSYFTASASAVQITQPEVHPDTSIDTQSHCRLHFTSNVVTGLPPGELTEAERLKNAFYLSLRPHHTTELKVVNNTFVGLGMYISYVDNWEFLAADRGGFVGFEFVNNICRSSRRPGQPEFFEEVLARDLPFSGLVFPVPGTVIRSNILEYSAALDWPGFKNFKADPLFVNEAQGQFQLSPGSPAIDAGDLIRSRLTGSDFSDACRRAHRVCNPAADALPDLGAHEAPGVCEEAANSSFVRGDCNKDRAVDLADAVFGFGFLFLGARSPSCPDRCDVNDDGELNITDGVYTLVFLFNGGVSPVAPFPQAGPDPSRDCLPVCR